MKKVHHVDWFIFVGRASNDFGFSMMENPWMLFSWTQCNYEMDVTVEDINSCRRLPNWMRSENINKGSATRRVCAPTVFISFKQFQPSCNSENWKATSDTFPCWTYKHEKACMFYLYPLDTSLYLPFRSCNQRPFRSCKSHGNIFNFDIPIFLFYLFPPFHFYFLPF